MTVMIASGRSTTARPLFPFAIPTWLILGQWLGGAFAWHLAARWLLAGNLAIYLAYGLAAGHIRRRLFPLQLRDICRDATLALRFRLQHDSTQYNPVQRLLYVLVGGGIAPAIVSGLAI